MFHNHPLFWQPLVEAFLVRREPFCLHAPFAPSRAAPLERHLTPKLGVICLYPHVATIQTQRDDIRQMWMTVLEQGVVMSASPGMSGLVDDEAILVYCYLRCPVCT